jgi:hypothetical protein
MHLQFQLNDNIIDAQQPIVNECSRAVASKTCWILLTRTGLAEVVNTESCHAIHLLLSIGALPAYQGLTLAGILATSAHGSGDLTTSTLADTVLEVTWVDGRGNIHVSKPSDPEFKAFNGGLGLFGVITELLLQLTPPTLTELITVAKDDKDMMNEINRLLKVGGIGLLCILLFIKF